MAEPENQKPEPKHGILETVTLQTQSAALRSFNPQGFVSEYLLRLDPRQREVITRRYGLGDGIIETLEEVGEKLHLTRERIRQIEKIALKRLESLPKPKSFEQAVELIFKIIEDRGGVMRENSLLDMVLVSNDTEVNRKAILFILNFADRFNFFKENANFHRGWRVAGFDEGLLGKVIKLALEILAEVSRPLSREDFFLKIRTAGQGETASLSDEALEGYLTISKAAARNAYEEWGLFTWAEISPHDVGDKACLVLLHHAVPEHYSKITELINKQEFDARVANKETVHNELIKDPRFVLVGRGIYALKKWGYEPGVVADIMAEVLRKAGRPLTKQEIIEAVLKQRLVKKNTIIVGLSNRGRFKKVEGNKYVNV